MSSKLFKEILEEVKPETTAFVKQYLDFVEHLSESTSKQDVLEEEDNIISSEQLLRNSSFSEDEI